jgi:5-methyltetrahydrofolate--homocysteine methyltransferase
MDLQGIYDAVIGGDEQIVGRIKQALDAGATPEAIINEALIRAMDEVGRRMKEGSMFIPEVLMAANIMKQGLEVVSPLLEGDKTRSLGKVVIGTVAGDLHDIGKNLVAMMLEGVGFEVIDLGTDVAMEKFLDVIEKEHPDVVGLSALLTTTMVTMEETVKGIGGKAKIMVGGAPVTAEYAAKIGADGYAPDAVTAVDLARGLMS